MQAFPTVSGVAPAGTFSPAAGLGLRAQPLRRPRYVLIGREGWSPEEGEMLLPCHGTGMDSETSGGFKPILSTSISVSLD